MERLKAKRIGLSLATILALGFSGCGSSSSNPPPADPPKDKTVSKLSGNLGSSYAMYKAPWYDQIVTKAYADGFGQIKKAIAIPSVGSMFLLEKAKEVTINADGTFSIDLKKQLVDSESGEKFDASWMVLLEKTDGTINFLSIPNSDGSESLVNLPISKATSNIALGDIDNSSDEGKSNIKLDDLSSKVSYSLNELGSLATTDDVSKAIINAYKNNYGKDEEKHISARLTVISKGDFDAIESDYSKAESYQGYAINISAGSNTILKQNFDNICSNAKQISFELPAGKSIAFVGNNTYSTLTSAGGTQSGTSCGDIGIFQEQTNNDGSINLNFGGGTRIVNSLTVPTGNWVLKFDGDTLGNYNLAYSLPVANGKIKLPTPAIKLDLDTTNNKLVKGFHIKWYIGDTEVPNNIVTTLIPEAMLYTQGGSGLAVSCRDAMLDEKGILKSYIKISECKENNSASANRYYKPTNADKALESIYVRYETPGNEVRFTYDN